MCQVQIAPVFSIGISYDFQTMFAFEPVHNAMCGTVDKRTNILDGSIYRSSRQSRHSASSFAWLNSEDVDGPGSGFCPEYDAERAELC